MVSVSFSSKFQAIIVVSGFTMNVDIAEELNTEFCDADSIQLINHSQILDVF
jgi:hypothetical protein